MILLDITHKMILLWGGGGGELVKQRLTFVTQGKGEVYTDFSRYINLIQLPFLNKWEDEYFYRPFGCRIK